MTYKLKKPIEIDGEIREELDYDLEELNGASVEQAIKDLAQHNLVVTVAEMDMNYHAALFAVASGISFADVKRMNLKDYTKVCGIVRDFLLED